MEAMTPLSATLTGKQLLREEEIAREALPWNSVTGIYFLLDGNKIVYIGQSTNVYHRIASHKDKQFDRYAFVPCSADSLDKLEALYIHCIRPKLNGKYSSGAMCAQISLDALINMKSNACHESA